jgi:hypothetical protein
MSAIFFKTLRWVITRSINKAQGGYGDTQPMNCVAKEPEARSLPLGKSRVAGKLGYVTISSSRLDTFRLQNIRDSLLEQIILGVQRYL